MPSTSQHNQVTAPQNVATQRLQLSDRVAFRESPALRRVWSLMDWAARSSREAPWYLACNKLLIRMTDAYEIEDGELSVWPQAEFSMLLGRGRLCAPPRKFANTYMTTVSHGGPLCSNIIQPGAPSYPVNGRKETRAPVAASEAASCVRSLHAVCPRLHWCRPRIRFGEDWK